MVAPAGGVSCCQRVFYARSCYGLALWAGRIWLPHPFWSQQLQPNGGISRGEGLVQCARAVEPAAYVELRALDVAKAEADATKRTEPERAETVRRMWPHRWPAEAVAGSEEAIRRYEQAAQVKRAYLDVVV